jgi:hypothetical protein
MLNAKEKAQMTNQEWLQLWREVAALMDGLTKTDHRFNEIVSALDRCDAAFLKGDVQTFNAAMSRVEQLIGELS